MIWVFPKIGVPQNGLFIMENPIKMDDLGGTTIFGNIPIVDAAPVNWFIPTVDTTHRFVLLLMVQKSGFNSPVDIC